MTGWEGETIRLPAQAASPIPTLRPDGRAAGLVTEPDRFVARHGDAWPVTSARASAGRKQLARSVSPGQSLCQQALGREGDNFLCNAGGITGRSSTSGLVSFRPSDAPEACGKRVVGVGDLSMLTPVVFKARCRGPAPNRPPGQLPPCRRPSGAALRVPGQSPKHPGNCAS